MYDNFSQFLTMNASFLCPQRVKIKFLVSFNGTFRRRPPSWKLGYVGGETRIISVERSTSFQELRSKIADFVCPNGNVSQFCFKYHVSEAFCGDDVEEEGPMLGLLGSDDDMRCMIEQYETMELRGKLHARVWIFVCGTNDCFSDGDFVDKHVVDVNGDRFCGEINGLVKGLGEGLYTDPKNVSENLLVLLDKYKGKAQRFGDDSLRKMVLKQQLLVKNLDGIGSFHGSREQMGDVLASRTSICQSSPNQLCSELGSTLNSESRNLNFAGDRKKGNEDYGQILPVRESKGLNLSMRRKGSNVRLLGQSHKIFGNPNGQYMSSSDQFAAEERSPMVPLNSNVNCLVIGLDPTCEFESLGPASVNSMNRENIRPESRYCYMVKQELAALTRRYPVVSSVYTVESLESSDRQLRAYVGGIRNLRSGLSDARRQRACSYHINNGSNVYELVSHKNFRLDGQSSIKRFYSEPRSSSNISKQLIPSRSHSAVPLKPFSDYYVTQGEEGIIDSSLMFNPTYCGEENHLKPVGSRVLEHDRAKPHHGHVAHAGNDKSFPPIDTNGNSLLGAREVDIHVDLSTNSCLQKIDGTGQALCENPLDVVAMGSQTPSNYVKESHSKNQGGDVDLSNSSPNPVNSIFTKLNCDSRLLDVEGGRDSLVTYQGDANDLRNNGASVVDLSLRYLSLESSGNVQLLVPCPRRDISQACTKHQSNSSDLLDEEQINSGPNFENTSDISSDSLSNNDTGCDHRDGDGEEEKEVIKQKSKSNSIITQKDEQKKISACLKGNDRAVIAALYTHLTTRELQIIKHVDLEYTEELGQGTYGTVYHGKWRGSDVAIKRLKSSCFSDSAKGDRLVANFWNEAHTLGQLHHPNIVALYGIVIDGPVNCLATVTEYMVNGSLKQVLRRKDRTIDRRKRLIIAMDAAFGMEYLHEKNIVHFDLKSHNFLVNMRDPQRPVCKIGDLGLSKIKQRTLVSGGIRGTIPWMAPELLSGSSLVSEKVDVFSFGIVLWELLTGEQPYANMRSEEIIAGIIRGNLRPEIPWWCDPSWRSLMERCWSSNPDCRPSFLEIAKELRAMAASMNIK